MKRGPRHLPGRHMKEGCDARLENDRIAISCLGRAVVARGKRLGGLAHREKVGIKEL